MSKAKQKPGPKLPSGLVSIDKGFGREPAVGIVGGKGIIARGFDAKDHTPAYYRVVEYGQFGVIVVSKHAVEVRVIQDGNLLLETKLYPAEPPDMPLNGPLGALMAGRPQMHVLMRTNDGGRFMFEPRGENLSPDHIISEQIHPGLFSPPPTMEDLDRNAPETEEMRLDVEVPTPPAASTDESEDSAGDEEHDVTKSRLTWAPSHGLVAIGVRILQESSDGGAPMPPDAFGYVQFQLNPFKLHAHAVSRLQRYMVIPSRQEMEEIMREEGFESDVPTMPRFTGPGGLRPQFRTGR